MLSPIQSLKACSVLAGHMVMSYNLDSPLCGPMVNKPFSSLNTGEGLIN